MLMRLTALFTLLALSFCPPAGALIEGILMGKVLDVNQEPIEGVKMVATHPQYPEFVIEEVTDKKGRYRIDFPSKDTEYDLELSREGYLGLKVSGVQWPERRQRLQRNFELRTLEAAEAEAALSEDAEAQRAIAESYNEAVAALNANDFATAQEKFLVVLEERPDHGGTYGGLARAYWAQEKWEEAVAAAQKSLELNPEDTEVRQVLYEAHSALGQTDEANAALAQMQAENPETAGLNLFNRAAKLFNDGEMAEAREAFEQVLLVQPDHPKAHYNLGVCYVSEGMNDKAREHLSRFVELAPGDPDAGAAQEMIQYLD